MNAKEIKPVDEKYCPELPAQVKLNQVTRTVEGIVMAPCAGAACAKYVGCVVLPELQRAKLQMEIGNLQ